MNRRDQRILNEQCKRDTQHWEVYDKFRPNYNRSSLTPKFYSRHEKNVFSKVDPKILHNVHMFRDYTPKVKHDYPETVNQEYGWITEPLLPLMKQDSRFFHPVKVAEFMKQEFAILADFMSKKPRFTGTPFFLQ